MFEKSEMVVLFESMGDIDISYQIIRNIVWNKDQFAGTMRNHIIYGIVSNDNISATYIIPSGKVVLEGIVVDYGEH